MHAQLIGRSLLASVSQNWVAAAGLTGGRVNRFNIVKQSKDYDADGEYVRHWLPELKDVPTQFVHEPWKLSLADQERFGVRIGTYGDASVTYPNPPKSLFSYGGDGGKGGKGGGKGGKGGGRGGGSPRNNVPRTPGEAAVMAGGKGRGKNGRGNGRKRVQHAEFDID